MPDDRLPVQLETGLEIVGSELSALVNKREGTGRNRNSVTASLDSITRHRQLSVDNRQCRVVFKLGLRRPFHSYHPVRQDRKTGIPRHNLRSRIGHGIVLGKSRANQGQQESGQQ